MSAARIACIAAALSVATPSAGAGQGPVTLNIGARFLSVVHFRTDSDFDPSPRVFDPDGQSEGQAATFFSPKIQLTTGRDFELFYEAELGWNIWSRNAAGLPNQFLPSEQQGLGVRHRQLWTRWRPNDAVDLRVGYQHFADPSRLFLDHEWAALSLTLRGQGVHGTLLIGQLPESTFEGIDVREDNFVNDSIFGGVSAGYRHGGLTVDAGAWVVGDLREVDRPLVLATGLAGLRFQRGDLRVRAHVVGQAGVWEGAALGGDDVDILAWAAQAGVRHTIGAFEWSANVLVLSPDDAHDGNTSQGAFFGSGKNHSPSTVLTENEHRDRYDNLDERMATAMGPFFVGRAGLVVGDASAGWEVTPWYTPRVIMAAGMVLEAENSLGQVFAGFELALDNTFKLGEPGYAFVVADAFVPGGAAAAFVNDVDRTATEPVFGVRVGIGVNL